MGTKRTIEILSAPLVFDWRGFCFTILRLTAAPVQTIRLQENLRSYKFELNRVCTPNCHNHCWEAILRKKDF